MKRIFISSGFTLLAFLGFWIFLPQRAKLEIYPEVGRRFTFALSYKSDARAPSNFTVLAVPSNGAQSVSISLEAELDWTVLGQDAQSTEFLLQLKPKFEKSNDLANRLISSSASARIRLKRNGELASLFMPQENFEGVSILLTEILRQIIPILAEKEVKEQSQWSGIESSGHGQVYSTIWKIAKLKSHTAILEKEYGAKQIFRSVSTHYELDRQTDFIKKVLLNIQTESSDASKPITSNLEFKAILLNSMALSTQNLADVLSQLGSTRHIQETLSNDFLMQRQEARELKKILGNDTIESILAQLQNADPKGQQANMRTYNKLKALFALEPKSLDAFSEALLKYDRLDDRFSMVATALTAVGSPDAQKILRHAIESLDGDETKKQRLIPNLSFTRSPTVESEAFLRNLAQNDASALIRATAHRALGTVAHNLREQDPVRTSIIFREYENSLTKAQSTADITNSLDVLGNIGIREQLDSAEPFFEHRDPEVRERAYNSLRHIQDSRTIEILIQALNRETIPKIREVIAEALSYQSFESASWVDRLRDLIYQEKNIVVVKHLLRSLSQNSVRYPAAISVIDRYAKDCGHPDLCGYVTSLLDTIRTQ